MPTMLRSSICRVPPPPGNSPTWASGRPTRALALSAAMRRWQASAISSPPPNAVPLSAATKGLPPVSISRVSAWKPIIHSNASSAPSMRWSMSRSPPAMKSDLADVTTTPLTLSSASALRTAAPKASIESRFITFCARPGRSHAMVAMPSPSTSYFIGSSAMSDSPMRQPLARPEKPKPAR